jgi:hypothetical protein
MARILLEVGPMVTIPQHAPEFRKLKARLTLLKVVRREVHARRHSGPLLPSRAMRSAWDAGLYRQPATFDMLSSLWSPPHEGWTEGWLQMLRQQSQQVEEEMHLLRLAERRRDAERCRQDAVDRFYDGGELHRLLHPQTSTAHSPMLGTSVPDSFVVAGDALSLHSVAADLAHIGGVSLECHMGSVLVTGIVANDLLSALQAVARPAQTVTLRPAGPRLAHSATDRLSAWEHSLATEATAQQAVCHRCGGQWYRSQHGDVVLAVPSYHDSLGRCSGIRCPAPARPSCPAGAA